jgi:hypothetical protein
LIQLTPARCPPDLSRGEKTSRDAALERAVGMTPDERPGLSNERALNALDDIKAGYQASESEH